MANIKTQTVSMQDRALTASDILVAGEQATSVTLINCTSADWEGIGRVLASLTKLHTLEVRDCDTGDALCQGIRDAGPLLRLRIRTTTRVVQRTAASLKMQCPLSQA